MMPPSFLLNDLAAALDESSNTVSQRLKRGGFTLPDADCRTGSGNWTRFTLADVATLAVIRALGDFGMSVRTASQAVQYIIEAGRVELTTDNMDAFLARWRDARLLILRHDRAWTFTLWEEGKDVAWPSAYLVLDVAQVISSAVERAVESVAGRERRRA
jgi:hypothetical protein